VSLRNKSGINRRTGFWAVASFTATLVIGFAIWWNYVWILSHIAQWRSRAEGLALHTLGDAWEKQSRQLSGSRAVNCGRVLVHANPKASTECALKAFNKGKPFRVRYDLQGFDSDVSAGLVYTPEGKLYGLVFDGDPLGQVGTSWSRQRTEKQPCPSPFHLYVNPNGRLNCFTEEAVPPKDLMSPNFQSY